MAPHSLKDKGAFNLGASLVAQLVKTPPAMQETWAPSLGQEDPPGEGNANPLSILAWEIPWAEEPGGLESMGWQSQTRLSDSTTPPRAYSAALPEGITLCWCGGLTRKSARSRGVGSGWGASVETSRCHSKVCKHSTRPMHSSLQTSLLRTQ